MKFVITLTTVDYFNNCYISLIIKNFDEMNKIMPHSVICLLNIISDFKLKIHQNIDRKKLDLSNYNNYMKSLNDKLKLLLNDQFNNIINSISHKCIYKDISKYDPNKPIFKIDK